MQYPQCSRCHRGDIFELLIMNRICLSVLLLASASVLADPPAGYTFHSYDSAMRAAQSSGKKMFIYFGREGCGYCDFTNKNAFEKDDVRAKYQANYELAYVDAESGDRLTLPTGERITERELGTRYKAFVTPVFIYTEPDGMQILKRVGIQKQKQLLTYDRFVTEGYYQKQSIEEFEAAQ